MQNNVTDQRTQLILPSENKKLEVNFNDYSHVRVVNNRVMIKEIKVNHDQTASGILTAAPTNKQKEQSQGVIVQVGEGYVSAKDQIIVPNYQVGDVVYFGDMAGIDFKLHRGADEPEEVKVVDIASIYFVDNTAKELYTDTTPTDL